MRKIPRQDHRGLIAALCGAACLLLLTGGYLWLLGGSSPTRSGGIGGPFTLTAADGRPITDRSFRGRYLLVYFGYTACRDVCPLTLATLGNALDALGAKADRVQPLFITVDPERDTPDVLRGYVAAFSPRLLGLTGTARQIRQVEAAYRVRTVAHPHGAGGLDTTLDHSSVLLLIGPDGRYLAPIPADETSADMAADIARRLS